VSLRKFYNISVWLLQKIQTSKRPNQLTVRNAYAVLNFMQQNDLPNFTMKIKLEEGIFATILAANFPNEKI